MQHQTQPPARLADGVPARRRRVRVVSVDFRPGREAHKSGQRPVHNAILFRQRRAKITQVHLANAPLQQQLVQKDEVLPPIKVGIHQQAAAVLRSAHQFVKVRLLVWPQAQGAGDVPEEEKKNQKIGDWRLAIVGRPKSPISTRQSLPHLRRQHDEEGHDGQNVAVADGDAAGHGQEHEEQRRQPEHGRFPPPFVFHGDKQADGRQPQQRQRGFERQSYREVIPPAPVRHLPQQKGRLRLLLNHPERVPQAVGIKRRGNWQREVAAGNEANIKTINGPEGGVSGHSHHEEIGD